MLEQETSAATTTATAVTDVEDLKAKYQVVEVPLRGECLIIPEKEFTAAMEKQLVSQGYRVAHQDFDGAMAAHVQLKKRVASKEAALKEVFAFEGKTCPDCGRPMKKTNAAVNRPVSWECTIEECPVIQVLADGTVRREARAQPDASPLTLLDEPPHEVKKGKARSLANLVINGKSWAEADIKKLIEQWNLKTENGQKVRPAKIAFEIQKEHFPERTANGVYQRLWKLRETGKIIMGALSVSAAETLPPKKIVPEEKIEREKALRERQKGGNMWPRLWKTEEDG